MKRLFVRKNPLVKGFEMVEEAKKNRDLIPKWLAGKIKVGKVPQLEGEQLFVEVSGGFHHIEIGDFVIQEQNDKPKVCKSNDFHRLFKEVEVTDGDFEDSPESNNKPD